MKRKLLVILLALAMLATFAPVTVFADIEDAAGAGWDESHTHYYNEDGTLATGWIEEKHSFELVNGEVVNWSDWYYADDKGEIQTGWLKYHRKWYYLSPVEGPSYGRMCTTPVTTNGKTYVLKENGVMNTNGWYHYSGFVSDGSIKLYYDEWYYSDSRGVAAEGWKKIGRKWYYFEKSDGYRTGGLMLTGWQKIDDKDYFFKSSGAMAANEWVKGYWWLNKDGSWTYKYKGSWKKSGEKWWFGDTSGWYAKNTTITIDGKQYTFDKSGYMV